MVNSIEKYTKIKILMFKKLLFILVIFINKLYICMNNEEILQKIYNKKY